MGSNSVRIIILMAAGFFWLLSLLASALLWFAIIPLSDYLCFGVTFSETQALAMILLQTFWSVIFFNASDTNNYFHAIYIVRTHLFVSLITLLNVQEMYVATLLPTCIIMLATAALAFKVAGGAKTSFIRSMKCK